MQFTQESSAIKILKSKFFIWIAIFVLVTGTLILVYIGSIKDLTVFHNNKDFKYIFS